MSRDYAKKRPKHSKKKPSPFRIKNLLLVAILSGVVYIALTGGYLNDLHPPTIAQLKSFFPKPHPAKVTPVPQEAKDTSNKKQAKGHNIHFDFYTILVIAYQAPISAAASFDHLLKRSFLFGA